jgi:hypothetical protein
MPNSGAKPFNGRLFAKCIGLLDSPEDTEAAAALYRMRAMLQTSGLTFYEAVETRDYKTAIWETFDEPECLREYFAGNQGSGEADRLREEVARLERDGARLARAFNQAKETIEKLQQQLAGQQGGFQNAGKFCRGCEWKRRILALIAAWPIAAFWFSHYPWSDAENWQRWFGVLLAAAPLLIVLARWRLLLFKRKYSWVTWRDNDIYRAVAEKWNGFLARLAMT